MYVGDRYIIFELLPVAIPCCAFEYPLKIVPSLWTKRQMVFKILYALLHVISIYVYITGSTRYDNTYL